MDTKFPNAVTADHVTYEINQIARNFQCLGQETAAQATAEHIELFWAPNLKEALADQVRAHPEAFSEVANRAIALLL